VDINKLIHLLPVEEGSYYFGFSGFAIESKKTFEDAQLGYRTHPNGSDLTGSGEGDWKKSWYVIGRDTVVGDPFFVDLSTENFPIYTAMHGAGNWNPTLVSKDLSGFFSSINYLQKKSNQDSDLIEPDENTISDEVELGKIYKHLISLCGEDASFFWECFIEQHQDWITESEE